MRFLILQTLENQHLYSATCRSLCAALRLHGQSADIYHLSGDHADFAKRLILDRYDAVVSFNSLMGATRLNDGRSVFDVVGSCFIGWHFDHPVYLAKHIFNPIDRRVMIHPNQNHKRFTEHASLGGDNHVLLPGGERGRSPAKDWGDRDMDVFVAATWNGEPARYWEALEDGVVRRVTAKVVERLLAERETSLLDAFYQACGELGYAGLKLDEQIFNLLRGPLTYVRHYDRLDSVRRLANSGFRLTICGSGWETVFSDNPRVTVIPSEEFSSIANRYGDAKVVLNLNAGNGGCERAINAMLMGSCVVSDFSSALSGSFGPREIRFFDRTGHHDVAGLTAELLESGQAEHVASCAHTKASATALWEHRASSLISMLS